MLIMIRLRKRTKKKMWENLSLHYDYYNSRTYMCICAHIGTHTYTHPTLRVEDEPKDMTLFFFLTTLIWSRVYGSFNATRVSLYCQMWKHVCMYVCTYTIGRELISTPKPRDEYQRNMVYDWMIVTRFTDSAFSLHRRKGKKRLPNLLISLSLFRYN